MKKGTRRLFKDFFYIFAWAVVSVIILTLRYFKIEISDTNIRSILVYIITWAFFFIGYNFAPTKLLFSKKDCTDTPNKTKNYYLRITIKNHLIMQIEIEGTITKVLELREGQSARTGNTWQRQDYVIETPGQYPRRCLFTVADGNIAMFNLQEGKRVRVTLSIDAHEYQERWFNDFRAVAVADASAPAQQAAPAAAPIDAPLPPPASPEGGNPDQALPWEQQ